MYVNFVETSCICYVNKYKEDINCCLNFNHANLADLYILKLPILAYRDVIVISNNYKNFIYMLF